MALLWCTLLRRWHDAVWVCGPGPPALAGVGKWVVTGNVVGGWRKCYHLLVAQVQVNFRAPEEKLALVERARGALARNAWLLEAVDEKLARDGLVSAASVADPGVVAPPVRPVSVRAPRGCRVVGVSRSARVLAEGSLLRRSEEALASIGAEDAQPIPGQVTVEEALAS